MWSNVLAPALCRPAGEYGVVFVCDSIESKIHTIQVLTSVASVASIRNPAVPYVLPFADQLSDIFKLGTVAAEKLVSRVWLPEPLHLFPFLPFLSLRSFLSFLPLCPFHPFRLHVLFQRCFYLAGVFCLNLAGVFFHRHAVTYWKWYSN